MQVFAGPMQQAHMGLARPSADLLYQSNNNSANSYGLFNITNIYR